MKVHLVKQANNEDCLFCSVLFILCFEKDAFSVVVIRHNVLNVFISLPVSSVVVSVMGGERSSCRCGGFLYVAAALV